MYINIKCQEQHLLVLKVHKSTTVHKRIYTYIIIVRRYTIHNIFAYESARGLTSGYIIENPI